MIKNHILEILILAQHKADPQLALHCKRVSCFSYELSKLLGQDEKFNKEILLAGLLHDIGFLKIDIDFSDVHMRMASTSDLEIFKSHSIEGERLLDGVIKKNIVLQAIRSHHERFNGEGYPDQLAEDAIPFSARIIAVADFYDTLLVGEMFGNSRSSPGDVKNKLREAKGIGLDPEITDTFLDLLDKIPVLFQPLTNNLLNLYRIHYLDIGECELGDLINQDGNVILKQGSTIDQNILTKIQKTYPGQKTIRVIQNNT